MSSGRSGQRGSGQCNSRGVAVIDLGDQWQHDPQPNSGTGADVGAGASGASRRIDAAHSIHRFANRNLAGQPLVLRMAARLSECQWVDQICAVGCDLPASVMCIHSAVVQPLSLPPCHLVERIGAIVDRSDADWIVYVPANRPFVDAGLIDGLLSKASRRQDCDYIGYASDSSSRQRMEHLGLAGEVCHADTIRRLRRNADRLPRCQTIAECLEKAPGNYQMYFVPPPSLLDHCDIRFAIEDESDWDDAQLLCDSVEEIDAGWQQVARLVMANENLRAAMAGPGE